MGRKPNPLILEFFERGQKLKDNSNRYPHTCKQCGENFPKGRIDSLTTHITKKCPAITESERMRACLELHGIAHAKAAAERSRQAQLLREGKTDGIASLPQGWSALETLAEASRQVDLNENNRGQKGQNAAVAAARNAENALEGFALQEQFTLENPPMSFDGRPQGLSNKDAVPSVSPPPELTPEERLQALLPVATAASDPSNISVAVAATARLDPSFLDPQLVNGDQSHASSSVTETTPTLESTPVPVPAADPNQIWGEMSYLAATSSIPMLTETSPIPMPMTKGGIRMDAADGPPGSRRKTFRARFTPARRKEVQEVRKLGACIRCRILRKNCGKGDPCDTCRKVLSPRVWRTGCVRTRLHEQLDLYSAGVQVVLSQNRINLLKDQLQLMDNGTTIKVSHFAETGKKIEFKTLVALLEPSEDQAETRGNKDPFAQTIMINQDTENIQDKVEEYTREALTLFIEREPSKFMRVTLEFALQRLTEKEDDLLRKAVDLWGIVESIDRERQWNILEKPGAEGEEPRWLKDNQSANDADIYTMICMQLNAGAERKANATSKALLNLMDRLLTDSKTKVGFDMFLTAMIFLNCVEKSTWAFKAWEQDHLRPGWPLERDPSLFTQQGDNLAGLLKMLLSIRKVLPQTERGENGKIISREENELIRRYFEGIDLDYDSIESRQKGTQFSPADSRSLELTFCSHLFPSVFGAD